MEANKFLNAFTVEHPFFQDGALAFIVNGELIFLYPDTVDEGYFQAWFSYEPFTTMEALTQFLNECTTGEHSEKGVGTCGRFAGMIKTIEQANK